jgi:hypothetical protein
MVQAAHAQQFVFAPPVSRACTPSHTPTRVLATDVDGNGQLDLLVPGRNPEGLVNWVPLGGDGVPGTMQAFACTGQTDAAAVGDFNGDGLPDLAFAVRAYSGRLALYLRTPQGLPPGPVELALDREPRSLAQGDWDSDGDLDLAVPQYGNNAFIVLHNDGAGSLAVAQRHAVEPWTGGTSGPQEIMTGDVDGDGVADLAVSTLGTRRIDVLRGLGNGLFAEPVAWAAPLLPNGSSPGITTAAMGDVDQDGDPDVVATLIATGGAQPIVVFVNDGAGGFAQRVMFDGAKEGLGWGTALGDLDGDGDLDVATGTALPGATLLWRNTTPPGGPIGFDPPQKIGGGTFVRDILIANVDGDCDADVVIAEIASSVVRVYRQQLECAPALLMGMPAHAGAERDGEALPFEDEGASFGRALVARVDSAFELAHLLAAWGDAPREPRAMALLMGDTSGFCGPTGPGGRCDEPHPTPGCFTTPCCEMVCSFDPACCELAWTEACVEIADNECAGLVCPQYGPCTQVHPDAGCEDTACCERITRLDGYCEGAGWDWLCVEKSLELCGLPPCQVAIPPQAVPEGEVCYEHLNDGPNYGDGSVLQPACGTLLHGTCTTGSPRDTDWVALPGEGRRRIRLTVTAEFPCEVHLVRGEFEGPLQRVGLSLGGQCQPATLEACLEAGHTYHAVITLGTQTEGIRRGQPCMEEDPRNPWPPDDAPTPGYDGVRYLAKLDCLSCGPAADLNGDGVVGGADLGLLLAAWGLTGPRPEDLDGDGTVGGADLGILLASWGAVLD